MTALDLGVVGAYLAATLLLSAWLARGQANEADYYVGDRRLPWWALATSTLATQSSANSFIGIPAFVALVPGGGLTWLQYELALPLAMLAVMLVLVPVFRGLGLVSIYEYLELRFDRPTRLLLSAVFLVSRALATGVAVYAAAVVVQVCTGLPLLWCVLVAGGFTVVYDMMGGMQAVVWTDVLQMLVLVGGLGLCIALALDMAGGVAATLQALDPARLAAVQWGSGLDDGARAPLWGFVVGGFVLYVAYYGVDQSQVQRQLSAASVGQAQRLLGASALARFPLTLLYALLGLALGAVYLQSAELRAAVPAQRLDFLVPRFIELFLPPGVRGLLVAAILAAAMSSVDSALNSLSASTMHDFVLPHVRPARQLWAARLVTLGWGIAITVFALGAGHVASNVIEGINLVGAVFYGPLLAAFGCGILDRRATGRAVRAGVAAGLAVNLLLLWALGPRLFWMWLNLSGLVAAVVVCAVVARCCPGAAPRAVPLPTLAPARERWRALRGWAVVLLLYTAAIAGVLFALGTRPAG